MPNTEQRIDLVGQRVTTVSQIEGVGEQTQTWHISAVTAQGEIRGHLIRSELSLGR